MITKNNYEEFFLLYIDNELSASEREAVEAFVMLHPDLQEELQMLQQTVLLPEPTFSFDKSSLFKSTEPVNEYNFEEKALLYIDNELPETDKQHLEAFVASNATFKPALALLQQTKLPLEVIECPNKEALYQKEDNVRPIFWIRFARIAVAAAVIGLGFIIYTVLPSNVAVNNYTSATSN
ncbi:MAG: anti-sigma factor family protein, partial [Chitinophagaceae bacterium]